MVISVHKLVIANQQARLTTFASPLNVYICKTKDTLQNNVN